ncbi:YgaP family membrane protein [Rhodococcus phenolicus]|uniref:YgaP family membrane protein n=1 Tax=Rhodococcus phenolicus TaxID=263849 RepID=UPI0009ED9AE9|nr:DUF2892 domain-containing protein [Rhodococcus phenolicus]
MAEVPRVNITDAERVGRMVVGSLGVGGAVALFVAGATGWTMVLAVLLLAAGVDLLVTGATGHCPLYHKLGYVPASLRTGSR